MVKPATLETPRLILRQWTDNDYRPFSIINADTDVMDFYPNILTEVQSNTFAMKTQTLISQRGWGFWAVELKANKNFIGFVGLHQPEADLPCSPCVEIGWRLAKQHWGKGYATEAANAALEYAFKTLHLNEIVAFTSMQNIKSISVMKKLKMINSKENFGHPAIPPDHPLHEHVLYKITKAQWKNNT